MWCWTSQEARDWCNRYLIPLNSRNIPTVPLRGQASASIPLSNLTAPSTHYLSQLVGVALRPNANALLWIPLDEIADEDLQLFYKLREAYGERRLLNDAPAHYCLRNEFGDLSLFAFLGMLFSWDFYVLANYVSFFKTHDEFLEVYGDPSIVEEFVDNCRKAGMPPR